MHATHRHTFTCASACTVPSQTRLDLDAVVVRVSIHAQSQKGAAEATLWRFMTTESHDDFKPQAKAQPEGAMKAIEEDVKKHDVLLFMKARAAASR